MSIPTTSPQQKLHQIIQNFYTKCAQCIVSSRIPHPPTQGKLNRWFNVETIDLEELRESLRPWKQSLSSCFGQTIPTYPTLVVEIFLDVAEFPTQSLEAKPRLDVRQKDKDGYGVIRRNVDLEGGKVKRLLLETWQLTLTHGSLENVSESLPALYKKCGNFFVNLQQKLARLPAQLCQTNFNNTGLPVGYRIGTVRFLQGQGGQDFGRELGLDEPLGPIDVDEHRFSGIETPLGTFNLHVVYRVSTDFVLANIDPLNYTQISMPIVTSLPPIWPQRQRVGSGTASMSSTASFSRVQRVDSLERGSLDRMDSGRSLDRQDSLKSIERHGSLDRTDSARSFERSLFRYPEPEEPVPIEDEHWQPPGRSVEMDVLKSPRLPTAIPARTRIHGDVRSTPSPSQSSMYFSASAPPSQARQINRPRQSVDRDQEDITQFLNSIERKQRALRQGTDLSPSSMGTSYAAMEKKSVLDKFSSMRSSIDGLERELEIAMVESRQSFSPHSLPVQAGRRSSQISLGSSPSSYHSANPIGSFRPSSVPRYGSSPLTRPPLMGEEETSPKPVYFTQFRDKEKDDGDVFRMSGYFENT